MIVNGENSGCGAHAPKLAEEEKDQDDAKEPFFQLTEEKIVLDWIRKLKLAAKWIAQVT